MWFFSLWWVMIIHIISYTLVWLQPYNKRYRSKEMVAYKDKGDSGIHTQKKVWKIFHLNFWINLAIMNTTYFPQLLKFAMKKKFTKYTSPCNWLIVHSFIVPFFLISYNRDSTQVGTALVTIGQWNLKGRE